MNTLKLNISTPDGDAFAGEVAKLDLRGIEGELSVMAGHVPFLTAVKPGHCDIMLPDGEEKKAVIDGGILNVAKDKTTLLASGFKWD